MDIHIQKMCGKVIYCLATNEKSAFQLTTYFLDLQQIIFHLFPNQTTPIKVIIVLFFKRYFQMGTTYIRENVTKVRISNCTSENFHFIGVNLEFWKSFQTSFPAVNSPTFFRSYIKTSFLDNDPNVAENEHKKHNSTLIAFYDRNVISFNKRINDFKS